MTELPRDAVCRNCQRSFPSGELDAFGWCDDCRAVVLRRATIVAWVAGGAAALVAALIVIALAPPDPRFLIVWLLLIAAAGAAAFKVAQRVAFEAIRARGVPPPRS